MGNYIGVWYDVAGTEDVDYALAEYDIGEQGIVSVKYYDSYGAVLETAVGEYEVLRNKQHTIVATTWVHTGRTNKEEVYSSDKQRQIKIVGDADCKSYRIYKRSPLMNRVERELVRRVARECDLDTASILWDPVLASIHWDAYSEAIRWEGIESELLTTSVSNVERYPARRSTTNDLPNRTIRINPTVKVDRKLPQLTASTTRVVRY